MPQRSFKSTEEHDGNEERAAHHSSLYLDIYLFKKLIDKDSGGYTLVIHWTQSERQHIPHMQVTMWRQTHHVYN